MPTLLELRRLTADKVAPLELARTGAHQGTGYAGTERSGDRRRVVSEDLAALSADGQEAEAPPDAYKGRWVYLCSVPPEQRRIPSFGLAAGVPAEEALTGFDPVLVPGTTPVAVIDVERPFRAVVPAGLELEVHGIPPLRGGRSAGYHRHIKHATNVILRQDSVSVPGSSGQAILDVTATFPWLTNAALFVAAQYVQTQAGVDTYAIPGAVLRFDADRVLLLPNTSVATGQSIPVQVMRPVGTWIKPAATGVWGESAVGLVDDGDECLGDADAIALVAAFHAAEEQAGLSIVGSPEQAWWLAKARALAMRTPFLRAQQVRRPASGPYPWPDFVSVDGPYRGRWGPGWR